MASRTKRTTAFQLLDKFEYAVPSLNIRLPQHQEGFRLTGNAVYRRCLILDGPGLIRQYLPVEVPALTEIPHCLEEVLFHHAVSESGEQFALPEILGRGPGNHHAQSPCLGEILQEHPGSWLGIDHTDNLGHFLFSISMDEEPHDISRLEYSILMEHTLAPWVIDSIDHPWIKQLTVSVTPTAVQRQDAFREEAYIG